MRSSLDNRENEGEVTCEPKRHFAQMWKGGQVRNSEGMPVKTLKTTSLELGEGESKSNTPTSVCLSGHDSLWG